SLPSRAIQREGRSRSFSLFESGSHRESQKLQTGRISGVRGQTVSRHLIAVLCHIVVAQDTRYAQPIVCEDTGASLGLGDPMSGVSSPTLDSGLVAPDGEGEHFLRVGDTLKPLHRYEAVDFLQVRDKLCCQIQVFTATPIRR